MTRSVLTDTPAYNFNFDSDAPANNVFCPLRHSFMHDLAREGDLLSAEVVFDVGGAIDQPNDEGRRPLHEAAFYGHLDMVQFLLECGADINAPIHPFGHTALYLAAQQSRYDIVQYIIKRGARMNVADTLMGTGLLHIAAAKNDMRLTGILLAAGMDVFQENFKGHTARDTAARAGHRELEGVLLKVMAHRAMFAA
jgi:ankyrin repeat protein